MKKYLSEVAEITIAYLAAFYFCMLLMPIPSLILKTNNYWLFIMYIPAPFLVVYVKNKL